MNVRFHLAARTELRESQRWYQERSPITATAFGQQVAEAISRIAESPNRYPLAEHGTRRSILQRFPFNIFYRVGKTEIVIVAVAHQKRRPGYWKHRD